MQPPEYENNNNRQDEIDLGPVLNGLRSFFGKIGDGLFLIGKAVHRHTRIVVFLSILSLLVGYGIYKVQKPVYYSSMVVTSQYLPPVYYHHIISELDLLIKDQNFEELSEKLNIAEETVKNFKTMYYLPLVIEGDTVKEDQPFRVVVASHDGEIFKNLTAPLSNFLENNEFAQQQKKIRTQQLESTIEMYNDEIKQLDSLKKVIEKSLLKDNFSGQGFSFSESPDPVTVYEQKLELFNSKEYNKSQLSQIDNIDVIYPFTVRKQADLPNLIGTLLFSLMVGILIGIIYAAIRFNLTRRG